MRANGGFPEPPRGEPVRVVASRHAACGHSTRVRLPGALPAKTVRRVRCSGCETAFEADEVEELASPEPPPRSVRAIPRPGFARLRPLRIPGRALSFPRPSSFPWRVWRWASVPIGATAVIGALLLIQGGGEAPVEGPERTAFPATAAAAAPADARLVNERGFALAMPGDWERDGSPPGDARFAAGAPDGEADAALWVQRAPALDLETFESRSLEQLRSLAGSAEVTERVDASTTEGTIIRLAADQPPGGPRYEVTLRAAGPFRYYLATTLASDAPRAAADGVDLIHGSFTPQLGGAG